MRTTLIALIGFITFLWFAFVAFSVQGALALGILDGVTVMLLVRRW